MTYQDDLEFLRRHVETLELTDVQEKARVAIVPAWQGRVMTSTTGAPGGESLGWINRELIASGRVQAHINPYGGADRFWLGPEGGQFALFFRPGEPFDLEHWQTPALFDTEPFEVVESTAWSAQFRREATLVNRAGTRLEMRIDRVARLIEHEKAERLLGTPIPAEAAMVAYATENVVANIGTAAWTREGGLPSIWILGMFPPSPGAVVVAPYKQGTPAELGPIVNDAYFGKIPADRLVVGKEAIFFRADGAQRGKIGVSPLRALPILGALDPERGALTIVLFDLPVGATDYVNSAWEEQLEPFAGDVANAYNDGAPTPGAPQLGPFFELESSSPALALAPGQERAHVHRTFHFQGPEAALDALARATLGVSLERMKTAFG
jgi:hypothetical protein